MTTAGIRHGKSPSHRTGARRSGSQCIKDRWAQSRESRRRRTGISRSNQVEARAKRLARIFHQATPVCWQVGLCSQSNAVWLAPKLDLGLRGFWRVLAGHIGHARLANRMIYWLRRSSPICLAQSSAIIPRPDEISGLVENRSRLQPGSLSRTPTPHPERPVNSGPKGVQ